MTSKEGPVVLVVGSLQQDVVVQCARMPALGQHLKAGPWRPAFGGKGGLQAQAAARAGRARILGAIGSDSFGTLLRDGLRLAGVEDDFLQTRDMAGSGLRLTLELPEGQFCGVSVAGANQTLDMDALARPDLWNWVGLLLLQNELAGEVNLAAAQVAQQRSIPVLLNAGPGREIAPDLLASVTHLVAEGGDLAALGAEPMETLDGAARVAESLLPHLSGLVILAGPSGLAARDRGRVFTLPGERLRVRSHNGAVDAFCGTLAAALARGLPLEPACLLARRAMGRQLAGD